MALLVTQAAEAIPMVMQATEAQVELAEAEAALAAEVVKTKVDVIMQELLRQEVMALSYSTTDMPDFPFFAVIKDNTVIGCGIHNAENKIQDPVQKIIYDDNDLTFVPMTLENSPTSIGMKYDTINNKFYMEENYA
jgi:hypothetical protein